MKKLKDYLDDKGIKYSVFARKIGITPQYFSLKMKEGKAPPAYTWDKVCKYTDGAITFDDLAPYAPPKRARKAKDIAKN